MSLFDFKQHKRSILGVLGVGAVLVFTPYRAMADTADSETSNPSDSDSLDDIDTDTTHHRGTHFLSGRWDCAGVISVPDSQKKFDTVGRLNAYRKGHWVIDRFQNRGPAGRTYRSTGWTRWDPVSKTLNRTSLDSAGYWGRWASQGWENGTLKLEGKTKAWYKRHDVWVRHILRKSDDQTLTWTTTYSEDGHEFKPFYKATCHKPGRIDNSGKNEGGNNDGSVDPEDDTSGDQDDDGQGRQPGDDAGNNPQHPDDSDSRFIFPW